MNILVVEDVVEQRNALVKMIERSFLEVRVYSSDSIRSAQEILKKRNIDLFLLDIELQDGSGINLAKSIRRTAGYEFTGIIFITANLVYMLEAFKEIHCYDFLVKPYNNDDVKRIITLFSNNNELKEKEGKYIVINIENSITTKIYLEDIVYIEYENRSCKITTKYEVIIAKGYGLNKILDMIKSDEIYQCHKAFAVNKKYINKISRINSKMWEIHFWNCEEVIPLGYKYKNDIKETLIV